MEGQGQVKRNYRARYCNTERQVVDVQPGGNVLKYIQDCFETAAREHPVLRASVSTSSCSSPDLSQNPFPPPSEKKKSLGSVFVNSVRSTFSTTHSKAQAREACSSGDDVFISNSPDEDEMFLGSPAVLIEETPRQSEEASPDQNGRLFRGTDSPPLPSSLPWNTRGSESEDEGEFLIAKSFGGPSTSWLSQPQKNSQKNSLSEKKSLTSPLPENEKTAKEHSIINVFSGDHVPVVEQGNSFLKQPQSVIPTALQSSTSKQVKKQKCPKNVIPKKAERQRKNIKSSARDSGRKRRVLVSKDSIEREPKELCGKQTEVPPQERLSPLGKKSAHVTTTFLVSPEGDCGIVSTQKGSCEARKLFSSMEQKNSGPVSEQYSFVRAINMNDLSGPVYNQNDKASSEHEIIGGNVGNSYLEPSVALEKDSAVLPSDSLKDKAVRLPDNTIRLRRSKRLRLKPLEYWRGERVMYKMKPSGVLMASGIISPKYKEPSKRNRMTQLSKMDLEKILYNANVSLKDPSQPAHVFDLASKQEVLQECVSISDSHLLFFSNEDLSIYKYFSTPLFSTGKLILKPLKEKGSQYSSTDTLIFHIVKGKLLFTLNNQCYSVCVGNDFFVPAGNRYNLQNITNEECILFFTQIKGNRLEGK